MRPIARSFPVRAVPHPQGRNVQGRNVQTGEPQRHAERRRFGQSFGFDYGSPYLSGSFPSGPDTGPDTGPDMSSDMSSDMGQETDFAEAPDGEMPPYPVPLMRRPPPCVVPLIIELKSAKHNQKMPNQKMPKISYGAPAFCPPPVVAQAR
ncbi:MAG: hypothetical protein ACLP8A_06500 [Methylovirgula sp.]